MTQPGVSMLYDKLHTMLLGASLMDGTGTPQLCHMHDITTRMLTCVMLQSHTQTIYSWCHRGRVSLSRPIKSTEPVLFCTSTSGFLPQYSSPGGIYDI